MKNILNWIKRHKIIFGFVVGFLLIVIICLILALTGSKNAHGNRCSDSNKYAISSKTQKDVEKRIKQIDNVSKVEIYTNLCTVKIIVDLKDDVDIESIKTMGTDILTKFSDKQLKYYDFALYVDSANKKSETYPINVSKHKSNDNFAW